jgi:hypothetical protein
MVKRKKVIGILMIILLIALMFITGYTFARYYKSIDAGSGSATIARWSFGSKNTTAGISLSDEKIAPGSNGHFEIEVDATDSEVNVEYEIKVTDEKNIPTNMQFYAITKDENGTIISQTEKVSSFTNLATNNLKGNIVAEKNNQKRTITVYWEWPFNEDDTSMVDTNSGTYSLDEQGNSSLDCGFNIEIIGRQAKEVTNTTNSIN